MNIPLFPYSIALMPWPRREGNPRNGRMTRVGGLDRVSRVLQLALPRNGGKTGSCISAPGGSILVQYGSWLLSFSHIGVPGFCTPLAAPHEEGGHKAFSAPIMLADGLCAICFGPHLAFFDMTGNIDHGMSGDDSGLQVLHSPNATPDGKLVVTTTNGETDLLLGDKVLMIARTRRMPAEPGEHCAAVPAVYSDGTLALADLNGLRRVAHDGKIMWQGPNVRTDRPVVLDELDSCAACDGLGATLFFNEAGKPTSHYDWDLKLAERPDGGWFGVAHDHLVCLGSRGEVLWRYDLPGSSTFPAVDGKGCAHLICQDELLVFTPRGDCILRHHLGSGCGDPALVGPGRLAVIRDGHLLLVTSD